MNDDEGIIVWITSFGQTCLVILPNHCHISYLLFCSFSYNLIFVTFTGEYAALLSVDMKAIK